jgi:trigger factor
MVARQDVDSSSAILTVTISQAEIKPRLEAELKKLRQKAQIKGFRQGQAPVSYLKKIYGASLFSDALNDMLYKELTSYLKTSGLQVLGQPLPSEDQEKFSFKIDNLEPEYRVNYETGFVPAFEISGMSANDVYERLAVSNLEELAEEDLANARKRLAKRTLSENDVQENDILRIAARELDGDVLKEGGYETTITLSMKDVADEALKTQLLFAKKGDTLRFNARTLENLAEDRMYRKYILGLADDDAREVGEMFEGVIEEVSRMEDAELDEEFFSGYFGPDNEVNTKEEAIELIKKSIQRYYEARGNAMLTRDMQERMIAETHIDLPERFLKRWMKASNEGDTTDEQIEDSFPAFAENLRWSLISEKLKDRFGIEASDEDVYDYYYSQVRGYFQMELPEDFIHNTVERLMKEAKDLDKVRQEIETQKIFVAARTQITIVDKPIPSQEFHAIFDSINKKTKQEEAAPEIEEVVEEQVG